MIHFSSTTLGIVAYSKKTDRKRQRGDTKGELRKRRDGGKETEWNRQRGREIGEKHKRRDRGKVTEGNRQRAIE
jgi:hypothetical protein